MITIIKTIIIIIPIVRWQATFDLTRLSPNCYHYHQNIIWLFNHHICNDKVKDDFRRQRAFSPLWLNIEPPSFIAIQIFISTQFNHHQVKDEFQHQQASSQLWLKWLQIFSSLQSSLSVLNHHHHQHHHHMIHICINHQNQNHHQPWWCHPLHFSWYQKAWLKTIGRGSNLVTFTITTIQILTTIPTLQATPIPIWLAIPTLPQNFPQSLRNDDQLTRC